MVKASDIYLQNDIEKLLKNKFVVVIGDSIQRAIYKDIVLLLQQNKYLSDTMLRKKGEFSFQNDELIEGGKKGQMNNGTTYREVRQYQSDFHLIRFYFVTRCYNNYLESILSDLSVDPKPDVIIMNSCLWDISRYGSSGVDAYKKNLERLFTRFEEVLPEDCLIIWNTTLPISKAARGGFLVPEIEFMNSTLRLDILEANFYASQIAVSHGCDVLDLHFYLRHQLHRRAGDGIHWDMTAHRRITNLLMTHITEAWDEEFPGRNSLIKKMQQQKLEEQKKMEREKEYRSPLEKLEEEAKKDSAVRKSRWNTPAKRTFDEISSEDNNTASSDTIRYQIPSRTIKSVCSAVDQYRNNETLQVQSAKTVPSTPTRNYNQAVYETMFRNHLAKNLQEIQWRQQVDDMKRSVNISNNLNLNRRLLETPSVHQRQEYNVQYTNQHLIDSYGGPIQKVDNTSSLYHQGVTNGYSVEMMQPSVNSNFQWQPYANENYCPPNRNVSRNHVGVRNVPYGYSACTYVPVRQVQMRPPWQVY